MKSRYDIRVTSVNRIWGNKQVVFRGIPLSANTSLATANKYVTIYADIKTIPFVPTIGQHWKVTGQATEKFEIHNNRKFTNVILKATKLRVTLPDSGEHFVLFIAKSVDFKGIGTVKAKSIWKEYQKEIYEILTTKNTDVLSANTKCKLSDEMIGVLINGWEKYSNLKYLQWFAENKIPPQISHRVIKFHKEKSVNAIQSNIYKLISFGMSFDEIDIIANEKFNILKDDKRRLIAAIEMSLRKWTDKGHTVATESDIKKILRVVLGKSNQIFNKPDDIKHSMAELVVKCFEYANESLTFIISESGLYHPTGMLVMEKTVAKRLKHLAVQTKEWCPAFDAAIGLSTLDMPFPLTDKQFNAAENALKFGVSAVFGGAGTGKTTVINIINKSLIELGYHIYQMALSGRAAKQMREATGYPSTTIAKFLRDNEIPEENTVVIIDEAAMVDLKTMFQIITHVSPNVKFILLGDPAQLAPIGAGLILHAIKGIDGIPQTELDIVQRQCETTGIPSYSNLIKHGEISEQLSTGNITFHEVNDSEINAVVSNLYSESPDSTQILAATYSKEEGGINIINQLCQQEFNPKGEPIKFERCGEMYGLLIKTFDPIIFTDNKPKLDIQNGTMGHLLNVYDTEESVGTVKLDDGREIELTIELLDSIKLAYSISLHKAQGSQFDRVIIPINNSTIIDRGWIYTAITRAKHHVEIVGNSRIFKNAVIKESKSQQRKIFLDKLLA